MPHWVLACLSACLPAWTTSAVRPEGFLAFVPSSQVYIYIYLICCKEHMATRGSEGRPSACFLAFPGPKCVVLKRLWCRNELNLRPNSCIARFDRAIFSGPRHQRELAPEDEQATYVLGCRHIPFTSLYLSIYVYVDVYMSFYVYIS